MLRSAYDWLATKATACPTKSGDVESDVDNESFKENATCNGQTPLNCSSTTPKMNKVRQGNPSPWGYTIAPRPATPTAVNIQNTPIAKTTSTRPNLSWDELSFAAEVLSPGFANRIVKDVKNQSQRSPDLRRQYPTAQDRFVRAGVIPNVRLGGRPKVVLSPSRNTSPLLPLTRSASFSRRMSTDFLSSGTPRMPEIRSVTSILDTSNDTKDLVSDPTSVEAVVAALHQAQAGKGVKRPRFAETEDLSKRAKCSSSSGSTGLPGASTLKYSRDQEEDQVATPCTGGGGEKRGREASPSISPENKRYCIADPMLASFSSSRHMQEYNSSQRLNRDSPISTYDSRRETDSESNKSLDSRNSKASDLYQQQDELAEDGATTTPSPWERDASDPSSGSHTPHSSNSAPQGISTTSTATTSRSSNTSSRAPTPRNPTPPRPTHIITLEAHKVDKVKNQHRLNKMLNILFHLSDEEKSQERSATPQEKSESAPTSEPSTSSAAPISVPSIVSSSIQTATTTSTSTILPKATESSESSSEDNSKTEVTESFTFVINKGSQVVKGKSEEAKDESETGDGSVSTTATIKLDAPQAETTESSAVADDTPATNTAEAAASTSVTTDEKGTEKDAPPVTVGGGFPLGLSVSTPLSISSGDSLVSNGGSKASDTTFSGFSSTVVAENVAESSGGEKQEVPSLGSAGFIPATLAGGVISGAGFFSSAIAAKSDDGKTSGDTSTTVSTPALFTFSTPASTSAAPTSCSEASSFAGFGAPVSEATFTAVSADSTVGKATSSTAGESTLSAVAPPYSVPSSLSSQATGGFGLGLFQGPSSNTSQAASEASIAVTSTPAPSISVTTTPNSPAITFGTSAPQQAEGGSVFAPQTFAAPSSTPSFGANIQGTTSSASAFSSLPPPASTVASASSNLFSFGATKAPAVESSTQSAVFAFGQSNMAVSTASPSITSSVTAGVAPVTPGLFTFGGGQSAAQQGTGAAAAVPSFKAPIASTAAVPKEATGFSFGAATTAAETGTQSSSIFTFGSGKSEAAAPSAFTFGGTTAVGAKPSTGFSFQATSPTTVAASFGTATEAKPTTGFAFGSAATTTTASPAFGASTTSTTTSASAPFSFGAPANTVAPSSAAFSFGSGSSSSSSAVTFGAPKAGTAFGGNPSSFTPSFGAAVTNSTPSFGSSSFTAAATSPFGAGATPATNPFSPATPAAPPTFADIKSPTPSFGSTTGGFGTQAPAFGSSPFAAAAPAPTTGDKPAAASPFQFGQSSSSNAPFAFGQNNPPTGGEQPAGGGPFFNFGQTTQPAFSAGSAGTNPLARRPRVRPTRRHR